jgi:hypothetical protein
MISLIKDSLDIKSIIKVIKNPFLIKRLFKRMNYYPGLKFGYSKSLLYKKIEIKFTTFFAKRKKTFRTFFFDKNLITENPKIYSNFSEKNTISDDQIKILKENGILVIENVLDYKEHLYIKHKIKGLIDDEKRRGGEKINFVETDDLYKLSLKYNISNIKNLNNITNKISKLVYGKEIEPDASVIYTKSLKIPEKTYSGDNNLHPDRYLPNMKMFYYPYSVDKDSAPFMYALGSHKINKEYIKYYIENSNFIFDEENKSSEKFLKRKKIFPVKENSLIIAFTNGFHGRSKFKKDGERTAIFLQFSKFDMKSLILS